MLPPLYQPLSHYSRIETRRRRERETERKREVVEGQADEWDGKANFKDRWLMKKDEERCREKNAYKIGR